MAEPIFVIDLSHHQGGSVSKVDGLPVSHWKALVECGVKAAIIKASQGTGHVDEDAAIHVERARAAGMEVGLYHFADGSSGTAQADHFIAAVKRANGGTLKDVLLVIDVENNPDPAGSDVKGPHVRAMARRLAAKAPRNSVLSYTAEGYWRASATRTWPPRSTGSGRPAGMAAAICAARPTCRQRHPAQGSVAGQGDRRCGSSAGCATRSPRPTFPCSASLRGTDRAS